MTLNRKIQITAVAVLVNTLAALMLNTPTYAGAGCIDCSSPDGKCLLCQVPSLDSLRCAQWVERPAPCGDAAWRDNVCITQGNAHLQPQECCRNVYQAVGCEPIAGTSKVKVYCRFMDGLPYTGPGGGNHKK